MDKFPFEAIATRVINGVEKKQLVTVIGMAVDNKELYECEYGLISNHECYMSKNALRLLTTEEMTKTPSSFPQQFYQSGPPGCTSMDAHTLRPH